jgi:hypothetical protein
MAPLHTTLHTFVPRHHGICTTLYTFMLRHRFLWHYTHLCYGTIAYHTTHICAKAPLHTTLQTFVLRHHGICTTIHTFVLWHHYIPHFTYLCYGTVAYNTTQDTTYSVLRATRLVRFAGRGPVNLFLRPPSGVNGPKVRRLHKQPSGSYCKLCMRVHM